MNKKIKVFLTYTIGLILVTSGVLYAQGKLLPFIANMVQTVEAPVSEIIAQPQIIQAPAAEETTEQTIQEEIPVVNTELQRLQEALKQQEPVSTSMYGGDRQSNLKFPMITGFFTDPSPENMLNVGDTINLEAVASDPQNRQIQYLWWSYTAGGGNVSKIYNGWSTNNTIKYTITQEDVKEAGERFRVGVQIKVDGSTRTGEYDDEIFVDYKLNLQ
jgi:hypothetical protein